MTFAEQIECSLIVAFALTAFVFKDVIPIPQSLSYACIYLSALLLLQGLIRDVYYLYLGMNSSKQKVTKATPILGLCIESTIGAIGIIVGLSMFFFVSELHIQLPAIVWVSSIIVVVVFGFLVKDYVVEFLPFRLRQDINHMNVIVGRNK